MIWQKEKSVGKMNDRVTVLNAPFTFPIYVIYRFGVFLKNLAFSFKFEQPKRVSAHTVSIGGLSFGGAGKTPMAMLLAECCSKYTDSLGKTAVISRGYRRSSRGFLLVSDGERMRASVKAAGDELCMLARYVPDAIVIADENRYRAAKFAVERFDCRIILLDDCFQHRYVHRDIDIVMLEPEVALHPRRFYLREGMAALKRAGIVVVLDAEYDSRAEISARIAKYTDAAVFWGRRIPGNFRLLSDNSEISDEELKYRRTAAFCALANPQRFAATLQRMGINPENLLAFPDHCEYSPKDIDKVARFFTATKAEVLLTTEKDAVKLPQIVNNLPIYYLTISIELEERDRFLEKVLSFRGNIRL